MQSKYIRMKTRLRLIITLAIMDDDTAADVMFVHFLVAVLPLVSPIT